MVSRSEDTRPSAFGAWQTTAEPAVGSGTRAVRPRAQSHQLAWVSRCPEHSESPRGRGEGTEGDGTSTSDTRRGSDGSERVPCRSGRRTDDAREPVTGAWGGSTGQQRGVRTRRVHAAGPLVCKERPAAGGGSRKDRCPRESTFVQVRGEGASRRFFPFTCLKIKNPHPLSAARQLPFVFITEHQAGARK